MKTNEAKILYRTHVHGSRIFPENFEDCTILQQFYLNSMSAQEIIFEKGIETRLHALCESQGIKFKK